MGPSSECGRRPDAADMAGHWAASLGDVISKTRVTFRCNIKNSTVKTIPIARGKGELCELKNKEECNDVSCHFLLHSHTYWLHQHIGI